MICLKTLISKCKKSLLIIYLNKDYSLLETLKIFLLLKFIINLKYKEKFIILIMVKIIKFKTIF